MPLHHTTDQLTAAPYAGQRGAVAKSDQAIQGVEGTLAILEDNETDQRTVVEELRTEISNVESQERSIRDNIQFRVQAKELYVLELSHCDVN